MSQRRESPLGTPASDRVTSRVCAAAFSPLRRSGQRRWGEVYVRGLLSGQGRKSIRAIAAVAGEAAAEQNLHHFISKSTWSWEPVRQELARALGSVLEPRAWVVEPMIIPKVGRHSVGVAQTYVPSLGRTVNRQYALGLWLAGEQASVPVEWCMILPDDWAEDEPRRSKAAIPDHACLTRPANALEPLVEAIGQCDPRRRPIVMDAQESTDVAGLAAAFGACRRSFLLRINENTRVIAAGRGAPVPAGRLAAMMKRMRRPLWEADRGAGPESLVLEVPVALAASPASPPLVMLVEWRAPEQLAKRIWVSNLTTAPARALLRLGESVRRVRADTEQICVPVGVRDFEGRSFPGWHRHMTLVSVAHAALALARLEDRAVSGALLGEPRRVVEGPGAEVGAPRRALVPL